MPKVSVLMPVYKTSEKYLNRTKVCRFEKIPLFSSKSIIKLQEKEV